MTNASLDSLRMNSRQFLRLCKEAGFMQPSGQLEQMTVDVIFAQCKVAGDRSISFKVCFAPSMTTKDGSGDTARFLHKSKKPKSS